MWPDDGGELVGGAVESASVGEVDESARGEAVSAGRRAPEGAERPDRGQIKGSACVHFDLTGVATGAA